MNTYKENIIKLIDNQILKGKENYGHTLDECPLQTLDAIKNVQEELIDALFYLENLKDTLFYLDNMKDVKYIDTDSIKTIKKGVDYIELCKYYDKVRFRGINEEN